VFLHGYLSSKESFYYQIDYFSDNGFRVTAMDLPGFGASAKLTQAYSVTDYARWLNGFLSAMHIKNAHIVAHSFGARVAIKLLSSQMYTADKLVLTGGAGLVKPRSPRYMRQVNRYRAVKKLFPKYAERHFGSKEYKTLSPLMRESYKKIVNEDLRGDARLIKNRTLLVYGKDDKTTPYNEEGKIFNECIKGSQLVLMNGGHFCFVDYPQAFNGCVEKFLRE
jgi:pimeloyl-ACP methyl ester carboxylesterase